MSERDWIELAEHYFHVAAWFAGHDPGTPVPEWCFLSWPMSAETVAEVVALRKKELGR